MLRFVLWSLLAVGVKFVLLRGGGAADGSWTSEIQVPGAEEFLQEINLHVPFKGTRMEH